MILDRMELNNFKGFYGKQVLSFSQDKNRHVTLIHGANGHGKTSLFTALNWCLYGDDPKLGGVDTGEIGELVNKKAITEADLGKDIQASVELRFIFDGRPYISKRIATVTKKGNGDEYDRKTNSSHTLYMIQSSGQTEEVPNPTGYIESILPSKLRTYFFFDGEKIEQFVKPQNEAEVKSAIKDLVNISLFENSYEDLSALSRRLRTEMRSHATDDTEKLLEQRASLEEEHSALLAESALVQDETVKIKTILSELDARLMQLEAARGWEEERRRHESDAANLENQRASLDSRIRDLSQPGYLQFCGSVIEQASAILEEHRERGVMPPQITQQLVQDLLERHKCICGTSISDGSKEHTSLNTLLEALLPNELSTMIIESAARLRDIPEHAEQNRSDLNTAMAERSRFNEGIQSAHAAADDAKRHLSESDHEDIAEIENRRQIARYDLERNSIRSGELDALIKLKASEIDTNAKALEKSEMQDIAGITLMKQQDLANAAASAVGEQIEHISQIMRARIEEAANTIFEKLVLKSNQWERLTVDSDYRLEIIDRYGMPASYDLSAGERQVLSLSFITGMGIVADRKAPLVMDTPLARLSTQHRESITSEIPKVTPQLVMFITDEELRGTAESNIHAYVGKEHRLSFDHQTGASSITAI